MLISVVIISILLIKRNVNAYVYSLIGSYSEDTDVIRTNKSNIKLTRPPTPVKSTNLKKTNVNSHINEPTTGRFTTGRFTTGRFTTGSNNRKTVQECCSKHNCESSVQTNKLIANSNEEISGGSKTKCAVTKDINGNYTNNYAVTKDINGNYTNNYGVINYAVTNVVNLNLEQKWNEHNSFMDLVKILNGNSNEGTNESSPTKSSSQQLHNHSNQSIKKL